MPSMNLEARQQVKNDSGKRRLSRDRAAASRLHHPWNEPDVVPAHVWALLLVCSSN
jgi:hypothetical protein